MFTAEAQRTLRLSGAAAFGRGKNLYDLGVSSVAGGEERWGIEEFRDWGIFGAASSRDSIGPPAEPSLGLVSFVSIC